MLNETFVLARALDKAGRSLARQHPDVKVPPAMSAGPAIRVCLNAAGVIVRCERVVEENYGRLWAYSSSTSGGSFPVVRLAQPLWTAPESGEAPDDRRKPKLPAAKRRRALKDVLALPSTQPSVFSEGTVELFVRLRERAETLARLLDARLGDVVQVCRAYLQVVPESTKTAGTLHSVPLLEALREYATRWLDVCDDAELTALEVLLLTASSRPGKKKAQLALDLDDVGATIYHSHAGGIVTQAFLDSDAKRASATARTVDRSAQTCAYGEDADLWRRESFPKVNVPVLGEVSLFSMNPDADCNQRYGRKGHALLPVSASLVLKMQDSLADITQPTRQGKTWRPIASGKPGRGKKPGSRDLFIVYVDGRPDVSADVADLFGTGPDTEEKAFNVTASAVCQALDGIRQRQPDSRLNLFVLRKASKGQAFAALSETPTVEEVLRGAEWWQTAGANVPTGRPTDEWAIRPSMLDSEKKQAWLTAPVPYPGQVVALLVDAQTGRSKKLQGASFGEVLDLMLQRPGRAESAARHILSLCLEHAGPLLRGLGGCQGRRNDKKAWSAYSPADRQTALRAVSAMGIVLYALGSRKEDYMHEAAFQVGRVLALADRLHECYCVVVRDGSMPAQLAGNALFAVALENPAEALADLAERLRVYQGWATTVKYDPGNEDKPRATQRAKKTLSRYRQLALELHQQGVPDDCDDQMKAHLLLGYLAKDEAAQGDDDDEAEGERK